MDLRVKLVGVPSVRDAVRKNGRATVNGLRFGFSDKLGAVVSEEANHAEVESFRRVPGYVIIDAQTGDLISEPEKIVVRNDGEGDGEPREETKLPTDPDEEYLKTFTETFKEASKGAREKINNDEYRRALGLSKVVVPGEAKKEDLIKLFSQAIGEQSETEE